MSIIKRVTLQEIVAHDFPYDPRMSIFLIFLKFILNKRIGLLFYTQCVDMPQTYFHTQFADVLKIFSYTFCRYLYYLTSRTFFSDMLMGFLHVHVVHIYLSHFQALFVDVLSINLRTLW